jgi:hypothetical protein
VKELEEDTRDAVMAQTGREKTKKGGGGREIHDTL